MDERLSSRRNILRAVPSWLWIVIALSLVLTSSAYATLTPAFRPGWTLPAHNRFELESGTVVHRIDLFVTNAFLIETDNGVILVDAGMPFQQGRILRALGKIGREDDLKLIYITHAHVDHYGSATALHEATGAPIAVHRGDVETMAAGESPLGQIRDLQWLSIRTLPYIERMIALLAPTETDLVLEDGQRLDEYGVDGYVLYTPGHTPGSSTLILDDQYAFAGDLVSATGNPHAQNSYAFSWARIASSLRRLQDLDPATHLCRPWRPTH